MAFFNLNKATLQIVTRLDNNYVYDVEVERIYTETKIQNNRDGFPSSPDPTNYSYILKGGYAGNLLVELSHYLNFTYTLVMDSSSGLTYSFDKATNLSIDLFAASYSLVEDRALSVDPTFVTGASRVQVLINHHYESFMLDLLSVPFQHSLWLCLLFVMVVVMLSSGVIAYLREKVPVEDALFQMLSAFWQKDCKIILKAYSSLILIWTVSFGAIIIHACFAANLISISTVKRSSIDSLDAIINSKFDIGFDVGLGNGSVLERIAKTLEERDTLMSNLLSKVKISHFRFESFECSMREVKNRPFAYIIDEETGFETLMRIMGHFPCDWGSISFAGVKYPWSMYTKKGSPFRPAINYGIQRFRETGTMRRLIQLWIPSLGVVTGYGFRPGAGERCTSTFTSIELENLKAAFVLLSSFAFIALFILLLENLKGRKCHMSESFLY